MLQQKAQMSKPYRKHRRPPLSLPRAGEMYALAWLTETVVVLETMELGVLYPSTTPSWSVTVLRGGEVVKYTWEEWIDGWTRICGPATHAGDEP